MLDRKGILLADPVVSEMTHAQWYYEFWALQKIENREREAQKQLILDVIAAARNTLVHVLGLDVATKSYQKLLAERTVQAADEQAVEEDESTIPFLPAVFYLSQPEVISALIEEAQAKASADSQKEDKIAEDLFNIPEADIAPLFDDSPRKMTEEDWFDESHQEFLKAIGVQII